MLLRFVLENKPAIEALGLKWSAVEEIFLCTRFQDRKVSFLPNCPPGSKVYQTRESQALGQSFVAIEAGHVTLPDPWTGEMLATAVTSSLLQPDILGSLFFVPLVYGFGTGQREFWAVCCELTGRLVHLYLPAYDIAIFEIDANRATLLDRGLKGGLEALRQRKALAPAAPDKVVAVMDMVRNFAHQMINHLSGLELLIARGLLPRVDEIWLTEGGFFGPLDKLFPEIAAKIRVFASREAIARALMAEPICAVRIGANCFFAATRQRLLSALGPLRGFPASDHRRPLIAVNVRTAGRRCVNLDEVIRRLYETLLPIHPNLGFVVDGWVFAEDDIIARSSAATCVDPRNVGLMMLEFNAAREAFKHVPASAIVRNLIGTSILESILGIMDIDCYLSHVGTLQHKIAFFSLKGGVNHGPREQMTQIDSGAYQAELGPAPTYLAPAMVEDVPGETERGPSFRDYRVVDLDGCAAMVQAVIGTA